MKRILNGVYILTLQSFIAIFIIEYTPIFKKSKQVKKTFTQNVYNIFILIKYGEKTHLNYPQHFVDFFFILLRTRFTKQSPVMVEVVEAEKTTELVSIGTFQQGSEKR